MFVDNCFYKVSPVFCYFKLMSDKNVVNRENSPMIVVIFCVLALFTKLELTTYLATKRMTPNYTMETQILLACFLVLNKAFPKRKYQIMWTLT